MDNVTVLLRIDSPRWGKQQPFQVIVSRDELVMKSSARTATCTWRENLDPVWSGEDLLRVFEADSIYPPAVLARMLEKVWRSWRGSELDASGLEAELRLVEEWLNVITRAKPHSEFWKNYF